MIKTTKRSLKLFLKVANLNIGIFGLSLVVYSLWMVRVLIREMQESNPEDEGFKIPWFLHAFLGIGIIFCAVTGLGHIAAVTTNRYCLSCYMCVVFLLLLAEGAATADICLNGNWEKDLPEDQSGKFDEFKTFVLNNFDTFKWICGSIAAAQVCSILSAAFLKGHKRHLSRKYDSDDDFATQRLPFLGYPVADLPYAYTNETYEKVLSDEKVNHIADSFPIQVEVEPKQMQASKTVDGDA
ncbi:Tetraspanin-19 like [Actinidia chinensis var. chinensis]|uniref:Tetraspanin-19 like n=1 Tax=Actinidia chinensis var. chinensis TaxID=1590841 RepID=A0A2R6RAR5_ACTCC|nr:Tetraspanin-19 like [Actinidia chinensis var. chinensis]